VGATLSNPHEFFTFQNFEGIILYVKNESDYTKRIVWGIVWGIVEGIGLGSLYEIGLGIVWGLVWGSA
jgi:hypothetical protein